MDWKEVGFYQSILSVMGGLAIVDVEVLVFQSAFSLKSPPLAALSGDSVARMTVVLGCSGYLRGFSDLSHD